MSSSLSFSNQFLSLQAIIRINSILLYFKQSLWSESVFQGMLGALLTDEFHPLTEIIISKRKQTFGNCVCLYVKIGFQMCTVSALCSQMLTNLVREFLNENFSEEVKYPVILPLLF